MRVFQKLMHSLTGLVIGTAGHIDHGKTSLVYALTGIDTDRLKEEKRRGISIDLGFAQMQLPDGPVISFVDVPGHEKFVRNMLAGAAGIEAVLLIVAANESVMPQTREHFEICRLMGLRHGLVVLTKCDLAAPAQLAQAKLDVQALVARSFLAQVPVIEVSAVTKAGLPELKHHLAILAAPETGRDKGGVMRLPVDRSFSLKGFGTVVTGTLHSGVITSGETLELLPQNVKVRVRGLQSQHAAVQQAFAGQRVAVNLAGIDQQAIARGDVLVSGGLLTATRLLDVDLHWLDVESPPSPRELFVLHIGTAEKTVRIGLTGAGSGRFARLRLIEDVVALPGDRFVLRRPSPAQTVGGGVVLDAFPPRRLNRPRTFARLEALNGADLSRRIQILLDESVNGRAISDLIRMTGASPTQLQSVIEISFDERAVTRRWLENKRNALLAWLRTFHNLNPNSPGAPLAAARLGLDPALAALIFKDFNAIRIEAETVSLATHKAQFSELETAALQKIEHAFRLAAFQPPPAADVMANAGVDSKKARALLETLIKSNRLIRLPDNLLFHADVIAHIRTSLTQQKGRRFSVTEFKGWMSISRKFAIPLLEYLDQQRVTRREGEVRVVL